MTDDTRTDDEIRQQYVDLGLSGVGLSAEPATFEAYCLEIITSLADLGSPAKKLAMSQMSSCGLFARRRLDRSGIRHPRLDAPYRSPPGAIADLEQIFLDLGARRGPTYRPQLGDFVVIANETHVFVVVGIDGDKFVTSQGGERTKDAARAECIELVDRAYDPATCSFDGRRVLFSGDAPTLGRAQAVW